MEAATTSKEIQWRTPELDVLFTIGDDEVVCIRSILPHGTELEPATSPFYSNPAIPLHQVRLVGQGNQKHKTSRTLIASYVSGRLKYKSHSDTTNGDASVFTFTSVDAETGLSVTANLTIYRGIPLIRATSTAENTGSDHLILTQLSTLTVGGLTTSTRRWWHDWAVSYANNTWFREAQWVDQTLPSVGIDDFGVIDLNQGHPASHACYSIQSHGSFSTGTHLPIGLLKRKDSAETWAWTIESNNSWQWEIGDYLDSIYVSASGPTSHEHAWHEILAPGQTFTSVPATIQHTFGSSTSIFQTLTRYRRRIRRPHPDNEACPVIFNDYMNCLMGDPTEDKIKSLLEAVLKTGAEYFVIDAGWYADDSDWWDDVGLWEPSKKRFPSGFKNLLDYIKSKGLTPGLWLEPEVVGVRSVIARQLPEEAFFHEHGARVVEKGRHQLDFRHPAVIERMTSVIDNLVTNYGAGYFKFDYNIDVIQGTDTRTSPTTTTSSSPGSAAHAHSKAYLHWVSALLEKHPALVIESCSSGAQRLDYAMLSIHPIQSTSDQQDPVRYAAIAASIFSAVTPEQAATWAYPQDGWSDEVNALTIVNALLGRVHLSGTLDRLSEGQMGLVREGVGVYKGIRGGVRRGVPVWPLGLPGWHDGWVSVGLEVVGEADKGDEGGAGEVLLAVWRRSEYVPETGEECLLPVVGFKGREDVEVEVLFPKGDGFPVDFEWVKEGAAGGALRVVLKAPTAASLFRLRRK